LGIILDIFLGISSIFSILKYDLIQLNRLKVKEDSNQEKNMNFLDKFNTNFSPRNYSTKEFIDLVTKNLPRREIFLVPVKKGGYLTTPFPIKDGSDRWCFSESGSKVILLDKHLIFQPTSSTSYMYTTDGKSYRSLDESKILQLLKKRPDLTAGNRFASKSEPCVGKELDIVTI
jgi:hypothetical protein